MKQIDLNCDVGEGVNNEPQLMPFISSCNIACGFHAGDEATMRQVVQMAIENRIAIGAHPSFDDRDNFGRKEVHLKLDEVSSLVEKQVRVLMEICGNEGAIMHHVKPHGALYNQAAKSLEISNAVIDGILSVDSGLKFFGLAESESQKAAQGRIEFVAEGFADRRYKSVNQLQSRTENGMIESIEEIKTHLDNLLRRGMVETSNGLEQLQIQSLCLHGDTTGAIEMIKELHELVCELGIRIAAP